MLGFHQRTVPIRSLLPGVRLDEATLFRVHPRKARNVARDPRCTISVATKGFDVMVAGEARLVTDPTIVAEIAALWADGGWPAQPDDSGTGITAPFNAPTLGPPPWHVYEVTPRTATAVGTAEDTPGSTRWRF